MSYEVHSSHYGFLPTRKRTDDPTVWRHNPSHDLESSWWTAFWSTHSLTFEKSVSEPTGRAKFEALFHRGRGDPTQRHVAWTDPVHLAVEYTPTETEGVAEVLMD